MRDGSLTIGALADACGVSRDAIRFYERGGLLPKDGGAMKLGMSRAVRLTGVAALATAVAAAPAAAEITSVTFRTSDRRVGFL